MFRKDNLLFGMMIGAVVGAVYATSNKQAEAMVRKGKAALKKQVQNL
jgi:gas vesicle protein